MTIDASQHALKEVQSQSELVSRLLVRLDRLEGCLGDVSLAAELQLLKRDLARLHALLSSNVGNINYLSIVTLVEAALASLAWKAYTPQILNVLRQALYLGSQVEPLAFEDFNRVRHQFASAGIPTVPRIDLTSLDTDSADGEET